MMEKNEGINHQTKCVVCLTLLSAQHTGNDGNRTVFQEFCRKILPDTLQEFEIFGRYVTGATCHECKQKLTTIIWKNEQIKNSSAMIVLELENLMGPESVENADLMLNESRILLQKGILKATTKFEGIRDTLSAPAATVNNGVVGLATTLSNSSENSSLLHQTPTDVTSSFTTETQTETEENPDVKVEVPVADPALLSEVPEDDNSITIDHVLPRIKTEPPSNNDFDELEEDELASNRENPSIVEVEAIVKTEEIHSLRNRKINRHHIINVNLSNAATSIAQNSSTSEGTHDSLRKRKINECEVSPGADKSPKLPSLDININDATLKEVRQQLCDAIKEMDTKKIEILLKRDEVREVLIRSTLPENKRIDNYCEVASLVGICVAGSSRDDDDKIQIKEKIIKSLCDVNSCLLDYAYENRSISAPIVRPYIHNELLFTLIKLGANPLARGSGEKEQSFLDRLASTSETDDFIIKILRIVPPDQISALVQMQCSRGSTPLLKLVENDSLSLSTDALEIFRRAGADANAQTMFFKKTPFLAAIAERRSVDVIRKLVGMGGDLNWKGKKNQSVLHLSAKYANTAAVEYFIEELQFDANIEDAKGLTSLDYLVFKSETELDYVEDFHEHKGTATVLKRLGGRLSRKAPLHFVTSRESIWTDRELQERNIFAVGLLLHLGFQANETDYGGNTPLHLICASLNRPRIPEKPSPVPRFRSRFPQARKSAAGLIDPAYMVVWCVTKIIDLLLKHGADIKARNLDGKTPYRMLNDEVPERDRTEVKNALEKAEKRRKMELGISSPEEDASSLSSTSTFESDSSDCDEY